MSGRRKRQKRTETAEERKAREDRERKAERDAEKRRANAAAAKAAREAEQARLTALLRAGGLSNLAVHIIVGLHDLIPPADLDIGALLGLEDDAAAQQPLDPAAVLAKIARHPFGQLLAQPSEHLHRREALKAYSTLGEKLSKWMTRLPLVESIRVPFLVPTRTGMQFPFLDGDGVPRERQPGGRDRTLKGDIRGQVQTVLLRACLSRDGIWPGEVATRTSAVWLADVDASTGVAAGWHSAEAAAAAEAAKQKKKERDQARVYTKAFDEASEVAREAAEKLAEQRSTWEEDRRANEEEKRRAQATKERAKRERREDQARAAGVKVDMVDVNKRGAFSVDENVLAGLWLAPASELQDLRSKLRLKPKLKPAVGVKPAGMDKRSWKEAQNVPTKFGGPETEAPGDGEVSPHPPPPVLIVEHCGL
jgi:hypothetical protein